MSPRFVTRSPRRPLPIRGLLLLGPITLLTPGALGDEIKLTGLVRDFHQAHVDFEEQDTEAVDDRPSVLEPIFFNRKK